MSKSGRNRQQAAARRKAAQQGAREREAAQERQAAEEAAEQRDERQQRNFLAVGSVVVVIALAVAFFVYRLTSPPASGSVTGTALPASVMRNVTTVPASELDAVGTGSVPSFDAQPVRATTGPALTANGKPEMLYIGAEFCPYCAAMRWAMAVALSRFGAFAPPLRGIHSSSTDTDPNTPTLTFYKARYSSKYLTFTPVENETIAETPLQSTTPAEQATWARYEPDPSTRGYPFIDFGNRYLIENPIYSPAVLAGKSWAQVAAALHDPSSPIARGALGAANYVTAAICKITGGMPSGVCDSSTITAIQARL
jgi:thiol-disulfide isomerase/thioredoxin